MRIISERMSGGWRCRRCGKRGLAHARAWWVEYPDPERAHRVRYAGPFCSRKCASEVREILERRNG